MEVLPGAVFMASGRNGQGEVRTVFAGEGMVGVQANFGFQCGKELTCFPFKSVPGVFSTRYGGPYVDPREVGIRFTPYRAPLAGGIAVVFRC